MKKLALLSAFTFAFGYANAQCNGRYNTEIFTNVNVTTVTYGNNTTWDNLPKVLQVDIHQPVGDTATERPLIILVHGGSFIGGVRNDPFQVELCNRFAKRGYVAATIEYRLGVNQNNLLDIQGELYRAVIRAFQDAKGAVRFFKASYGNGNPYGIDTSEIFLGGYSAGAITALYATMVSNASELPTIAQTSLATMGGLEGTTGNPGFTSKVKGAISYAGGMNDTSLINAGDIPFVSVHGTLDDVVPYTEGFISYQGFNILPLFGSQRLQMRAMNQGVLNPLLSLQGIGHELYDPVSFNAGFEYVNNFVRFQLNCHQITQVAQLEKFNAKVYPNPSTGLVMVEAVENNMNLAIYNLQGALVYAEPVNSGERSIDLNSLPKGMYILRLAGSKGLYTSKIVLR